MNINNAIIFSVESMYIPKATQSAEKQQAIIQPIKRIHAVIYPACEALLLFLLIVVTPRFEF